MKACTVSYALCNNPETALSWSVVRLTAAKFTPNILLCLASPRPIPRTLGFKWFRITSAWVLHNLVIYVRSFGSHVQFAARCAPVKISNSAECSVLQALQFQKVIVRPVLPGGTDVSHNWPNQSFVRRKINICTQMPTFELRICPYVRAQGLATVLPKRCVPCHPPGEGDTKICYIIYKGNVSSV
jgi:hypothetical protein